MSPTLRARTAGALSIAAAVAATLCPAGAAFAGPPAFGVTGTGSLVRFDVDAPASVTTIGSLGFVPEGIDFRPPTAPGGSQTLYAIDVGPTNSQLYTVSLSNGAATPVGAAFPSQGTVATIPYNLTTATAFSFDFNPTTLQGDGSVRIRLVGNNRADLRLNSDTGQVAAVDGTITYAGTDANAAAVPSVSGSAYINARAAVLPASGTTVLYNIDSATNALVTQNPPNNGTLNTVGLLFAAGVDVLDNVQFDIYTDPGSADATIGGDRAFAFLRRAGDTLPMLYDVDLATGTASNGRLVGGGLDLVGGIAVAPEPGTMTLAAAGALMLLRRRRA